MKKAPPKGLTPRQKVMARGDVGIDDHLPPRPGPATLRHLKAMAGLDRAPLPALDTVEAPKDRDAFVALVNKGVSRALSLASTSKEASDAVKSATWWFKVCYSVKDEEPYGGALGGADGT